MSANAEIIAELRRVLNERDEARAALASCIDCAMWAERSARWHDDMQRAERERDAAAWRLRDLEAAFDRAIAERDEARASAANQFRRGAEAMREACARWMSEREGISQWVYDDALSALPIPEEP